MNEQLDNHIDTIMALMKTEYYHNKGLFDELTSISDEIHQIEEYFVEEKDWKTAAFVQDIWSSLQRIKRRIKGLKEDVRVEKIFLKSSIESLKEHLEKISRGNKQYETI
ncbi:hypothetical protein [Kyrpidia sp.]|uniref:hypothetical protein n=1 Tax=Kyrpidia sp. TaxID=2073077 RepID=UPI0025856AE2|nr:hypothetical protein [Kyrpidia sp.]MCL6575559.1 hypothetical protein [Kyrpidia sp.]